MQVLNHFFCILTVFFTRLRSQVTLKLIMCCWCHCHSDFIERP
ncbi:hypothetical protein GLYMA_04G111766v4 [Glycine max]|nr:hypothetical protein GLYMA_04G111766v4 [Glycine max]KAH1110876.1 hypothetical protein GYH30_009603 [Glycine max]